MDSRLATYFDPKPTPPPVVLRDPDYDGRLATYFDPKPWLLKR